MRTQDTKNIHCKDYLTKVGVKFARSQNGTHGLEYVYHSPNRKDMKPSLCVNLDRNIWSDVLAGEGGRLIELVCYTHGLMQNNVREALWILDLLFPEYRGGGRSNIWWNTPNNLVGSILSVPKFTPTSLNKKGGGMNLISEKEIYRYPLKNYLAERKIPLNIANEYLKEVDYKEESGNVFYALWWKCGETYGLRSHNFKGFLGKGIDISVFDQQSSEIYLFEGIFDFLAYLAHTKRTKLPVTAIVLNSVVLVSRLEKRLRENSHVNRVNCYFDNDHSGRNCFSKLKRAFSELTIQDYSNRYA